MTPAAQARITQLEAELAELRRQLADQAQLVSDLEMELTTAVEHGDLIESQLVQANDQLQSEVTERSRAERRLAALLDALKQQKDDLEILVGTLVEHSDSLDQQMWSQLLESEARGATDPLTNLANRRHMEDHLDAAWRASLRDGRPLSVLMCDVDYFKLYNDAYGHPAGDACLQAVADRVKSAATRPADLAARYGGEEFAVILPETTHDGALQIAQKLVDSVRALAIDHAKSQVAPVVTLSVGVATIVPAPDSDPTYTIALADRRLYRAKQLGRDQACGEYAD